MVSIYKIEDIVIIGLMFVFALVSLLVLYKVMKKSALYNGSLSGSPESNFLEDLPEARDNGDSR